MGEVGVYLGVGIRRGRLIGLCFVSFLRIGFWGVVRRDFRAVSF